MGHEKHTRWDGKRVYLATTVAEGCILGAALSETANEKDLTFAYAEFMVESQEIDPNYQPISVNTDIVPFIGMAGVQPKNLGKISLTKPLSSCVFSMRP